MSNVRDFGAAGDGQIDDTAAIRHALDQGDGVLEFPPGTYRIRETIQIELPRHGPCGLVGLAGAAKIVMDGPGPAFFLHGSHQGSADPDGFDPGVWSKERMPTVLNLEIEGRHAEADGFLVEGTMQTTFEGVLLRELRDAIRVERRARNLLVSHCHIYHNRRNGIFFDRVNLHQAIITGSHISYNQRAGIHIAGGQVRNVQITGNDIEYNYADSIDGSADVLIDTRYEGSSIREGTITGNTIQARVSPGGANVRIVGKGTDESHLAGLITISGNMIGSQQTNVHLDACRTVVVTGNIIYSGHHRNLLVDGARNIVIGPNSFDHNPDYDPRELATGIRLVDSRDVTLSGLQIQDSQAGRHTVENVDPIQREGLLEIVRCQNVLANGLQVTDGTPANVAVRDSSNVSLSGCMFTETRTERMTEHAVVWTGEGRGNLITGCRIQPGTQSALRIDEASGVTTIGNHLG